MIFGLSIANFTLLHVAISLIAIVAGAVVVVKMLAGDDAPRWTALFLVTTLVTSVTGFFFPFDGVKPSHVFGILSLVVLVPAAAALYVFRLAGPWRWLYVVGALFAFYLNAFVAVVQAFQKIPVLTPLAPTQSEPPFLVAQLVLLGLFVYFGVLAVRRFRPAAGDGGLSAAV
jgi:hypothetical protein